MHSAVIKSRVTGHSVFACLLACSGMRYSTSNAILATIGTPPARGTMMLTFSVFTTCMAGARSEQRAALGRPRKLIKRMRKMAKDKVFSLEEENTAREAGAAAPPAVHRCPQPPAGSAAAPGGSGRGARGSGVPSGGGSAAGLPGGQF